MDRILEDISKWPIEKRRAKLEEIYEERIGVPLNLDNPQRYTEKAQWLKLYHRDPLMTKCVDKLTFKQFVREKIGNGYTAPLIDVWHNPADVKMEGIPDRCVIKSNCAKEGEYLKIIDGKEAYNLTQIEIEVKKWWFDRRYLNTNSFMNAYYDMEPCVLIEEYISDMRDAAAEYKFWCFEGTTKYIYCVENHFVDGHNTIKTYPTSWFTVDWDYIDVKVGKHGSNPKARPPRHMDEMMWISRKLSEEFSFVRVDFMETEDRVFLSELAFCPYSGLEPFVPDSFDYVLGKLWKLNKDK